MEIFTILINTIIPRDGIIIYLYIYVYIYNNYFQKKERSLIHKVTWNPEQERMIMDSNGTCS